MYSVYSCVHYISIPHAKYDESFAKEHAKDKSWSLKFEIYMFHVHFKYRADFETARASCTVLI